MKRRCLNRRSQVTIFVIIAIVIVGLIGGYFLVNKYYTPTIPENIVPVYDNYISCLKNVAKDGASIMGSQGGYMELPDFSPGSEYAPFSNQFDFLGTPVAYWYYISNNGISKEQIPTKKLMEKQLADYVKLQASMCDLKSFENQGYQLTQGQPSSSSITIQDNKILLSLGQKISVNYGDSNFVISNHKTEIDSNLGSFYNLAREIYNYEKTNSFLENYTLDVLNTYAPVTGTELSCSPKVWVPQDVFKTLRDALSVNIGAIKIHGDYYDAKKTNAYFIAGSDGQISIPNNRAVSLKYSSSWPSRFEVWPTTGDVMVANPVGNQPGLSAMGFCYAPYKFVYDLYFPVLIQIYNSDNPDEIFQFPVSVVISKNVPREAQKTALDYVASQESICEKANREISISTYNVNLGPVESEVKFKCINEVCNLGKTKIDNSSGVATLNVKVPECYNGFLIANSEGYGEKKQQISTNEESSADIILDREFKLNLEVYVDGVLSNNLAVLTMQKTENDVSGSMQSLAYPSNRELSITEGDYHLELKVYSNKEVSIPAVTTKQCVNVPSSGISGIFGFTEEKCTNINVPAQKINDVIFAGGKTNYYFTPSELAGKKTMKVYATKIKSPESMADVALSFDAVNSKVLDVTIV